MESIHAVLMMAWMFIATPLRWAALAVPGDEEFHLSGGVALLSYTQTASGFVAIATYPGGTAKRCELRHSWGDEPVPTCAD